MQSLHLPTTRVPAGHWWGTSMPKDMEEPPVNWVGQGWKRSGSQTGPAHLRGGGRVEGFPQLEGPLGAQRMRGEYT